MSLLVTLMDNSEIEYLGDTFYCHVENSGVLTVQELIWVDADLLGTPHQSYKVVRWYSPMAWKTYEYR